MRHFDKDACVRDMRNELIGLPSRKKLKDNAVPTLPLPGNKTANVSTPRTYRTLQREGHRIQAEIVEAACDMEEEDDMDVIENENENIQVPEKTSTDKSVQCNIKANVPQLQSKIASLE